MAISRRKIYDVVIVGAGAAGIACLHELVNRGYEDILCLEALSEPGGRIRYNKKFGDIGGMCLHLPYEFLDAEDLHEKFWGAASLLNFAKKNNFSFYRESHQPRFRLYRNGERVSAGIVNHAHSLITNAIDSAIRKIERQELPADISLKDALAELLDDDICRSLINTVYSSTDTGLDAGDISFLDYYNTMPSNPGLFPEDGMGTLFKAYARQVKDFISLNKEVISVTHHNNLVKLVYTDTRTETTSEVYGKTLVVTVSIGVLQSWIKENRIQLSLEKKKAINAIKMGKLNKNIFLMEEKFFIDNNIRSFTHINIRSNRLARDANFLAIIMNGNHYLINFIGGKKSMEYEKKGTSYARKEGLRILASAFGADVYEFCVDSYLSHWNTDKYFRGAYSAAADFNARLQLSKPLDRHIYRAGEEVRYEAHESSYHTHISGALDSGFMAANQVIRELETGQSDMS